jgi:hypothetical protein
MINLPAESGTFSTGGPPVCKCDAILGDFIAAANKNGSSPCQRGWVRNMEREEKYKSYWDYCIGEVLYYMSKRRG